MVLLTLTSLFSTYELRAATLEELLLRFNQRAQASDLDDAERIARQALAEHPSSREAQLALADVLLWQGRYPEAIRGYEAILAHRPGDRDARRGLASALYWWGDYRAARREFLRIADDPEAERALAGIAAAAAPGLTADALYRTDSQPYRVAFAEAEGYAFSDPLTRWSGAVGSYRFDEAPLEGTAPFARIGVETAVPSLRTTLRGSATVLRFLDDETTVLGSFGADYRAGTGTVSITASRRELFGSELSVLTHPWVDSLELRWQREDASVRAETLRFFDDNSGSAVDGWFLVPVGPVSLGASAAWRDTAESRFTTAGVYDPYWTPLDLWEGRLVMTAKRRVGRVDAGLHLDGGIAREQINGTYHPWRASISMFVPVGRVRMGLTAERNSTVFYDANELRASLAANF